jgi:hypothetical protein
MTVMLRAIGIPARVAVGFYPGEFDDARGGYLYVQRNAHAWTEVFFPGYGWIPFEPTSSQPLIRLGAGGGNGEGEPEPTSMATEESVPAPTPTTVATPGVAVAESAPQPPQPTAETDGSGRRWLLPAVLGVTLLAMAVLISWLGWTIPLRGMSPAGALYARMRRVGGWIGINPSATVTPGEYGRAFAERVPQSRPQARRIVESYEIDMYGPESAGTGWLDSAGEAWKSLRRHLPAWLLRNGRR